MENINTEIQEVDTLTDITSQEQLETDPVEDDVPIMLTSEETVNYTGDYDAQILAELQESNDNWDLFLDSFPVTINFNGSATSKKFNVGEDASNYYAFTTDGRIIHPGTSTNNRECLNLQLQANKTYNFTITVSYSANYYIMYGLISADGTSVIEKNDFIETNTGITVKTIEYTVTPSNDCILVINQNYSNQLRQLNVSYTGSYNTYDSYTLSEIGNSLTQSKTNLDTCNMYMSILILILLFEICYKWIRNFGKFFNRKGDL